MTAALAREVRALALPAIAHSLLQTLVFVVDRAMLGHHAQSSLAAMQIAGALEWSIWSIFSAFTVGTIARVGRHVGAKDSDRARAAVVASLGCALAFGLLLAALGPLIVASLGWAFPNASPVAREAARGYLQITLSASPIVFLSSSAVAALQASGDTRTPLAIGVVANVVHVALNRVLILGGLGAPALGPRGAAISTTLTFALEVGLCLIALTRARRDGAPSLLSLAALRSGRAHADSSSGAAGAEARDLARVSLPALAERCFYHAGYIAFVWIIAKVGDVAMAANQALISVESICWLSADGFGVAAAALVAQKLGAARPAEAIAGTRIALRYAIVLLTSCGLLFLAFRRQILPIFSSDPHVLQAAGAAIVVLAVAQPFMAIAAVLAAALRGAGQTRTVFAVSAVGAFVVRIGCTWLFAIALQLGLVGVWLGSTCDWAVRSLLLVAIVRVRAREREA